MFGAFCHTAKQMHEYFSFILQSSSNFVTVESSSIANTTNATPTTDEITTPGTTATTGTETGMVSTKAATVMKNTTAPGAYIKHNCSDITNYGHSRIAHLTSIKRTCIKIDQSIQSSCEICKIYWHTVYTFYMGLCIYYYNLKRKTNGKIEQQARRHWKNERKMLIYNTKSIFTCFYQNTAEFYDKYILLTVRCIFYLEIG